MNDSPTVIDISRNANRTHVILQIILALVIQAGLSLILAIWSAFIDGSLTCALYSYFEFSDAICSKLLDELEEIPTNTRARTKSNFLFIRHQLQRMHIEQMSETIIDVQILNGKIFS
jgi:hypothetical protein